MTKKAFKAEVVADLEHQLQHKGKPYTAEHWYMSDLLYPLDKAKKQEAIEELINECKIMRVSANEIWKDSASFPILML